MTGFTTSAFLSRNRVSAKVAFEGLELCERKLSCTVLRGLDGSNPVRLLGDSPKISDSAIEFPFPRWRRRFGCFSERVLLGPRNPSSSQNVRTRCRRAFVRQTSTALDRTAWTGVR